MENNILLSICIPTFNRAESLSYSLRSVIEATKGFESSVEIIVSNNCSTDLTNEVLKSYSSISNYKYFTNQSNIGFNYNYFKLIELYSSGKYCWIIGDDDFLIPSSVRQVLEIISKFPDVDFIYSNYRLEGYQSIINNFESPSISDSGGSSLSRKKPELCVFNELFSKDQRSTNILLTFISSSIFCRSLLLKFDKSYFNSDSMFSFRDLFPHSYMFALLMMNRKAYYFENPLVTAAIQVKEWDRKLPILYLKYIPELFQFYRSIGYSKKEMFKTNEIIAYTGIINFFRCFRFSCDSIQARLVFLKYYLFTRVLFSALLKLFIKVIKKLFKNNL